MWQETELLLWKPPTAWFSINAFFTPDGLRNWYVNFERPTTRTGDGFDTFDLTVDLVIAPDLATFTWKDEDEYAHVRRLGIVTDTEHRAVQLARAQVLAMLEERAGPFADADRWRPGAGTRTGPCRVSPARSGRPGEGAEHVASDSWFRYGLGHEDASASRCCVIVRTGSDRSVGMFPVADTTVSPTSPMAGPRAAGCVRAAMSSAGLASLTTVVDHTGGPRDAAVESPELQRLQ
ncbi:DUF402 domain-containing protein [Streptomyces sp. RKAG290]|uniref:DUF402 domain-containing protein n=1 Tax=Streptomyces sp. RKAG290 TaxID=2888348 RepID=UPI00203411A1|nr:DUF402 domain-containing protein [Streptomyces sp. RKAG290]MCM2416480.1 DUF402 domain-containing protein [Streptomyces sp. RKAG290]